MFDSCRNIPLPGDKYQVCYFVQGFLLLSFYIAGAGASAANIRCTKGHFAPTQFAQYAKTSVAKSVGKTFAPVNLSGSQAN